MCNFYWISGRAGSKEKLRRTFRLLTLQIITHFFCAQQRSDKQ